MYENRALPFVQGASLEGWDGRLMRECCTLISARAEAASVVYEVLIRPLQCNVGAVLHGGAVTTLSDHLTSTTLFTISNPGLLNRRMVSRTLTMTYLRPVPMGTKAILEVEVVAAGRSLAHVRGVIKSPDGEPCVTRIHDLTLRESTPKL